MQSTEDLSPVMLSAEVAELFGVGMATVNRWATEGRLGAFRIGPRGHWRFPRALVMAELERASPT